MRKQFVEEDFEELNIEEEWQDEEYVPVSATTLYPVIWGITESPWQYLAWIAGVIEEHIEMNVANEQEYKLEEWVRFLGNDNVLEVPRTILDLAAQYGVEQSFLQYDKIKKKSLRDKNVLFHKMKKQEYEKFWRAVKEPMEQSQEAYPSLVELRFSPEEIEAHKKWVIRELEKYGFLGSYPMFYKEGPLPGIHLIKSHGMSYVTTGEKLGRYYILCRPQPAEENIGINFLCGTVFPKEESEETDIYSCMFDRAGKAFYTYLTGTPFMYWGEAEEYEETCRSVVSAAVKVVQRQKLTREERSYCALETDTGLLLFLGFIFMAVLYGLFMTVGFMGISLIIVLSMTGSWQEFVKFFMETPWWIIGVSAGLLFGSAMTLVDYVALKR